ncbi:bacterioferritin-associated ferredoxin [Microvirga arabica]|uniref:Bacterioferritin-associated ferredoxin n=1 Tax=Microvirga arabica TaxID=1128671 RepID=A0ABV6YGR7_9HYPH
MIVCSCNTFSDGDVKACLSPGPGCPRTPAQVYRCLGCSPKCGRCAPTIRSILTSQSAPPEQDRRSCCDKQCCVAPVKFVPVPAPSAVKIKREPGPWSRGRQAPPAQEPAIAG